MTFVRRSSVPLAVGVDAGGTWVRICALSEGRVTARATERGAQAVDLEGLLRAIWRRHGWRPSGVAALVVASKGIWTPRECGAMARRLSALAGRVRVIPDAQAATLGALGGQPGVLVLAGTGSIVVGHDGRGRWERAGGLGPLLGDEGSGFWIGREWLRQTSGGSDFKAVRVLVHAPTPVSAIAALAPMVIARARHSDRHARRIIAAGQAHLAAHAAAVARRLRLPSPITMSWAGGVLADPWFRAGLIRAVARGLRARWIAPKVAAVVAAARLAEALAASRPRRPSERRLASR
jgi:N-acetylglucosamine kinase-like BadF-type ATPase